MSVLSIVQKIDDLLRVSPVPAEVGALYNWLNDDAKPIPDALAVSNALAFLEATDDEAASIVSATEYARRGGPSLDMLLTPAPLGPVSPMLQQLGSLQQAARDALVGAAMNPALSGTAVISPGLPFKTTEEIAAEVYNRAFTHVTTVEPFMIHPDLVDEAASIEAQLGARGEYAPLDVKGQLSESDLTAAQVADLHAQGEKEGQIVKFVDFGLPTEREVKPTPEEVAQVTGITSTLSVTGDTEQSAGGIKSIAEILAAAHKG